MEKPILSILIPARNEFPNVIHTIYSVIHSLESDGFTHRDFEILISNNCSDDEKWPQKGTGGTTDMLSCRGIYWHGNVKFIYDPIAGNHKTTNKLAKIAQGKYIFRSDAHMAYAPGFFKRLIQTLEESKGLVHTGILWMGAYPPLLENIGISYTISLGEEFKGCVDEETEILTTRGWIKWHETSKEDEYVTVNIKTKTVEFQKATDLTIADYDGEMIELKGRSVDLLLTPEHRTLYDDYTGEWKIEPAKAYKRNHRIPIASQGWNRKDWSSPYKDDLVSLIGWIITEGNYREDGSIQITQYNEENNLLIRKLLERLGFTYFLKKRGDIVVNINPSKEIREILPQKELTFDFIQVLNSRQHALLYETLINGDGYRGDTITNFYQVNKVTADAFQFLCVLMGKATRNKVKQPWLNRFGKKPIHHISIKENQYASQFSIKKKLYRGKIWCPTLENGTIFTRRNGVVNITGQTWNNYHLTGGKDWFYIPSQGHAGLGMDREQFLSIGGYNPWIRAYGGGEFYMDMKCWMLDIPVVAEPRCISYHLSCGRGYAYHHDDYIHNVFLCGLALGADDWIERSKINWLRTGRKETIEHLWNLAQKECQSDRHFIARKRKHTFNENIVQRPWDKLNDQKHGKHYTALKIFHDTWLPMMEKSPAAKEAYEKSAHQKGLEKFINENLSEFVYKRK